MTEAPTLSVEVAFDDGPFTVDPAWTELPASDVLRASYRYGRLNETDEVTNPGTASIELENSHRRYDPQHSDGDHYGSLLPGKQVRMSASYGGDTFILFRGVINPSGWQQVGYAHPSVSSCMISLVDPLGYASRLPFDVPIFQWYLRRINEARRGPYGYDTGVLYPFDDIGNLPASRYSGINLLAHRVRENYQPWSVEDANPGSLPGAGFAAGFGVRRSLGDAVDAGALRRGDAYIPLTEFSLVTPSTSSSWTFGVGVELYAVAGTRRALTVNPNGQGLFIDPDGSLVFVVDEANTEVDAGRLELDQRVFLAATWDHSTGTLTTYNDGQVVTSATGFVTTGSFGSAGWIGKHYTGEFAPNVYLNDWTVVRVLFSDAEIETLSALWLEGEGLATGEQAALLLDAVGLPHNVSGGRVAVVAASDASTTLTAKLAALEATERGRLFYDHTAERVEMIRHSELTSGGRYTLPQWRLTDTA